jgi:predicted Zn-dependent protease
VRLLLQPPVLGLALSLLLPGSPVLAGPGPQDLPALAEQGKAALAAGRFDEAARLYGQIVAALPDEPGMRLNLGMALSMAGRPAEAIPHLEAALRLRPDLLPASLFLGAARLETGHPAEAVAPLRTFLDTQPDDLDARGMLAQALSTLGRHEDAAREYAVLSERAPRDPRTWFGLGRSYEAIAEGALEELQRSAPESPWVLLLVADGLVAQDRDKSAFALYRETLETRPDDREARAALAGIYERTGHPDWAATERERAAALPPHECRPDTGECAFRDGRYAEALASGHRSPDPEQLYWRSRAAGALAREAFAHLEALPSSPEATLVRVQVLRARRRYTESKEALEGAIERWPDDHRLRHELATLLVVGKEYDAARALLAPLLEGDPDSAELNLLMGETWVESRQPAQALPYLERAVARNPGLPHARALLGRAYLDAGDAAKAVPHLEAALPSDTDGSLHLQLARAYQASGQAEKAQEARLAFQEDRRRREAQAAVDDETFAITPP